jgi:hypothetical protein
VKLFLKFFFQLEFVVAYACMRCAFNFTNRMMAAKAKAKKGSLLKRLAT